MVADITVITDSVPPINIVENEISEFGKKIVGVTAKFETEKPIFSDDESDIQPRNSMQLTNEESMSDVGETAKLETEKSIFSDDEKSFESAIKPPNLEKPIFSDDDDSNFDGTMEIETKEVGSEEIDEFTTIANSKQKSKGKKSQHLKRKEKKRLKSKSKVRVLGQFLNTAVVNSFAWHTLAFPQWKKTHYDFREALTC